MTEEQMLIIETVRRRTRQREAKAAKRAQPFPPTIETATVQLAKKPERCMPFPIVDACSKGGSRDE